MELTASTAVPTAVPGESDASTAQPTTAGPQTPPARRRLDALDASRGSLVALRVFIGSQVAEIASPALQHAHGFGLTVADLVLPGFLFTMGMAVPVSMSAFLRTPREGRPREHTKQPHLLRIVRRATLLYAIGFLLGVYPFLPETLEHVRFVGVLQRLAVAYLTVSLLYVTCAWSMRPVGIPPASEDKAVPPTRVHSRIVRSLARASLLGGFPLVCVVLWIVATYTFHNPWPQCADVRELVPDCSLEAYLDTNTWGAEHNLDGGTFDPEGLMSTLVAVVNCWAGLVIGMDIVRNKQRYHTTGGVRRRACLLIAVGVTCGGVGLTLSTLIPIGKQLWTPSYALVTIGIMTVGFGLAALAFDGGLWSSPHGRSGGGSGAGNQPVRRLSSAWRGVSTVVRRGTAPVGDALLALGRNPLFFYVLSELVIVTLDYIPVRYHGEEWTAWSVCAGAGLATWMPAPLASVVWAALWLLLFYVPLARLLVSRGWYIRV
ncbi:hypothetical protein [Streptomyces sp. NPDC054854]